MRGTTDIGKKIVISTLAVNVIQLILTVLLILNSGSGDKLKSLSGLLYLIDLTMAINSLLSVGSLYFMMYSKGERQGMVASINDLRNLNKTIRAQRHDYLNHIQVVYGLLELGEAKEALKYMEPVYKDILKVNKALKTSEPAVNALLQAKLNLAEEKDIDMEISITSDLKELVMPPWEFCRIAGNLIDNSIYALEGVCGDKKLYIEISEDLSNLEFSVRNNGPKIPDEITKEIFTEGFTTKGNRGEGMGLYIVKELVSSYKGQIRLVSTDTETMFNIELPKILKE